MEVSEQGDAAFSSKGVSGNSIRKICMYAPDLLYASDYRYAGGRGLNFNSLTHSHFNGIQFS